MNPSRENVKGENLRSIYSGEVRKNFTPTQTFLDKLGERLIFEKNGSRIYDMLLTKYEAAANKNELPPIELLKQFHREEKAHIKMLTDIIKKIGGDPDRVTPSANMELVANHGWSLVLNDPRTSFEECLHILHLLELADNAAWELLVELAEASGLTDDLDELRNACAQEENHLVNVKNWVKALIERGFLEHGEQRHH